jgi:hypothetical protein
MSQRCQDSDIGHPFWELDFYPTDQASRKRRDKSWDKTGTPAGRLAMKVAAKGPSAFSEQII